MGVQRQEEDCRALADRAGFEVVAVFTDNDISAYSGKLRPGYRNLLAQLSDVDVVLAWHTDRLHRQPAELEEYIELCAENAVVTHTVQSGQLDLTSATGTFAARMFGNMARYESEIKAARVKRAMEQKVRAGQFTGGPVPFGWVFEGGKPVVHGEQAAIVREVFSGLIAGRSLGSMVRELNDAGVMTGAGKPWGYSQLRQLILRPRNAGLSALHGEIVGESEFPAIVSENIWLAGCSILRDPSRRRSQSNKAVHLLAGIAQCHCGALLRSASVTSRTGEKHKIYRCTVRGAGHVSKRIEYVDDVVNRVMVALSVMSAKRQAEQSDSDSDSDASLAFELELDALRQRLYDMTMQAAEGIITANQLGLITSRISDKITQVEAQLADNLIRSARPVAPSAVTPAPMDSPEALAWLSSDIDVRRDYVRSVCNVVLLPHGKASTKVFNPDTVRIVLKNRGDAPGPLTTRDIAKTIEAVEVTSMEDVRRLWPHLGGGDTPPSGPVGAQIDLSDSEPVASI